MLYICMSKHEDGHFCVHTCCDMLPSHCRSSTALLESLATTLEPLFHRDFTVDLRSIYPSIPLQMDPGVCKPKTILNLKSGSRKHDKCHAESQGSKNNAAESIAEKPTHEKQLPKRKKEHDKGRMASPDICRVLTVAQILEEVSKQEMAAAERMNSPGYVTVPFAGQRKLHGRTWCSLWSDLHIG